MIPNPTLASIVVPIGADVSVLSSQLGALWTQLEREAPRHGRRIELLLSCNGTSMERVREVISSLHPEIFDLTIVDSRATPGPSAARNAGWRAAKGQNILFCDADDMVAPGWLTHMLEALAHHDIVGGSLDYQLLNAPELAAMHSTCATELPTALGYLPYSPSCNLGVSKELLETLNGFDEELFCGEDMDLCWRAAQVGHTMHYAGQARVNYRLRDSVAATFKQARSYGRSDAPLLQRHRQYGAHASTKNGLRELASVAATTVSCLGNAPGARLKAAARWGTLLGRIEGYLQHKNLAFQR